MPLTCADHCIFCSPPSQLRDTERVKKTVEGFQVPQNVTSRLIGRLCLPKKGAVGAQRQVFFSRTEQRRLEPLYPLGSSSLALEKCYHHHASQSNAAPSARLSEQHGLHSADMLEQLVEHVEASIASLDEHGLSELLCSLSELSHQAGAKRLLDCVIAQVRPRVNNLSPKLLSSLLRAFAKYEGTADLALLAAIASCCRRQIGGLSTEALAQVLWRFAQLGFIPEDLLAAALSQSQKLECADPKSTVYLLGAWAKFKKPLPQPLLARLSRRVSQNLHQLSVKEVGRLCCSLAHLRFHSKELSDSAAEWTSSRLSELSSEDVAELIWSFARLDRWNAESAAVLRLLRAASQEVTLRDHWEAKSLVILVWSFSKLRYQAPADVLMKIASKLADTFSSKALSPIDCSMAVSGFAGQRFLPSKLLTIIVAECAVSLATFRGIYTVSELVHGLALLGVSCKPILKSLGDNPHALRQVLSHSKKSELIGLFWAIMVSGSNEACYHGALSRVLQQLPFLKRMKKTSRRLTFSLLLASEEHSDPLARSILKAFGGRVKSPYFEYCAKYKPKPAEMTVVQTLRRLKFRAMTGYQMRKVQQLVPCAAWGLSSAFVVDLLREQDVATVFHGNELAGQEHSFQVMGSAQLRHRLIRSQGFEVVLVRLSDWELAVEKETHAKLLFQMTRPFMDEGQHSSLLTMKTPLHRHL